VSVRRGSQISREQLEAELLTKLQHDVLSDAAVGYTLEKVEREVEKRLAAVSGEVDQMRRRKAVLETEIKNLSRAIASGPEDVQSLRAEIVEREREISAITAKTLGTKQASIHEQMVGLRKFVKESLRDIRELIGGKHTNAAVVRQELARHIDAITLLPDDDGASVKYKGKWHLVGNAEHIPPSAPSALPQFLPVVTITFEGFFRRAA